MADTVQGRLVELGLLRPDASGAGWEFTPQAHELFSATLKHPHKSQLAADLLALGVIEPAPMGSSLRWTFTPQGRRLVGHLLKHPLAVREPDSDLKPEGESPESSNAGATS